VNKRALFSVLGYILFLFGMLSLILGMIGLTFKPLAMLDAFGKPLGFLLRVIAVLLGMVILYVSRVNRE
jgi:uncharacterized membrane protein